MEIVNLNSATRISEEQIKQVMDYHPWGEHQIAKGNLVRESLGTALKIIIEHVPPCPDRTVAIRKIREARMDCNSAITHGGKF